MIPDHTTAGSETVESTGGSATIVELLVPAEEVGLGNALARLGGARIELERAVVHDGPEVTPYLRVRGAKRDSIEAAFAADESVDGVSRVAGSATEWLYRVEWARDVRAAIDALGGDAGSILTAVGTDGAWRVRVLFPAREALTGAHEDWAAAGFSVELRRIHAVDTEHVNDADAPRTTER